jgi:hypothetical protein
MTTTEYYDPKNKKAAWLFSLVWNTNEWVLVFSEMPKINFNCIGSVMVSVLVLSASVGSNLRLWTLLMPRRHVSSENRIPMRHICRPVVTCQDDIYVIYQNHSRMNFNHKWRKIVKFFFFQIDVGSHIYILYYPNI